MFSQSQQNQNLLNCLTCQEKEVTTSIENGFMDFNSWSSSYSTDAAVATPLFQHLVYEDSPVMTTPFLDSGCFSPIQTSSFSNISLHNVPQAINTPAEQHLGLEVDNISESGPIFTGNPMELLINKSKGVNSSPIPSSPSDGITTPLFGPIVSAACYDGGSAKQEYHVHQQEIDAFLQESHPFEMNPDLKDWPCFHGGDVSLFQELEGMINTTTTTASPLSPSSPSSTNNHHQVHDQQYPTTQYSPNTSPSTTTTAEKRATSRKTATSEKNKRKRINSEGQPTENHQNDDDEDGDNKNNKRQSANKTQKIDRNEKRYGCPICRRKFSRRYNLNTHIRTHNVNRIKEFECDVCGFGFDRKHDRDRHMVSVHRGERDYSCNQCAATFCRRDALARHALKSHPEF
ncbi:hypothetical protein BCR42DRAFT_369947 [Absidia repens]|uniref:C2H2-type domain-containing protein n=1 Tax=Absidia repens TaxID=90262 RepID=A0A1X2IRF3_9FUNG|nr:hypothetical protein BCR42DRAFT_369947 [Absidia repens]